MWISGFLVFSLAVISCRHFLFQKRFFWLNTFICCQIVQMPCLIKETRPSRNWFLLLHSIWQHFRNLQIFRKLKESLIYMVHDSVTSKKKNKDDGTKRLNGKKYPRKWKSNSTSFGLVQTLKFHHVFKEANRILPLVLCAY